MKKKKKQINQESERVRDGNREEKIKLKTPIKARVASIVTQIALINKNYCSETIKKPKNNK